MEQERRYCMKFMYQNIHFSKIEVRINVYGRYSEEINTITYTLEDISYPNEPMMGSIKDVVKNSIPNGEEELEIIREKGEI